MQYTSNSRDMIKNCLLPTLECIYGSKGYYIPEIKHLVDKFPYSNERILCLQKDTSIHKLEKGFEIPLSKKYNSRIYSSECRNKVERFSDKKQLIVGAIIHDGNKILYLEAINQKTIYREHNYTMVLGHVSTEGLVESTFTPSEIFRINLAKELSEELDYKYYNSDHLFQYFLTSENVKYIGTFTSNEIPISNKHILVAYEVFVGNVDDFISNEPAKHIVHTINMDEIHTIYERLDIFFLKAISKVSKIRDMYLSVIYNSYKKFY